MPYNLIGVIFCRRCGERPDPAGTTRIDPPPNGNGQCAQHYFDCTSSLSVGYLYRYALPYMLKSNSR